MEKELQRLEGIKEHLQDQFKFRQQKVGEIEQFMSQIKQELSENRVEESDILAAKDETDL